MFVSRECAGGGVDLVLRKNGITYLVQCKQWKKSSLGAPVVREKIPRTQRSVSELTLKPV
jgi:hypothetical protein